MRHNAEIQNLGRYSTHGRKLQNFDDPAQTKENLDEYTLDPALTLQISEMYLGLQ